MQAIDPAELEAQTGGDADLAREVLELFAGQCRSILPRLADPALPRAQRADLAHTLKGSAAGVGAIHVRALAPAPGRCRSTTSRPRSRGRWRRSRRRAPDGVAQCGDRSGTGV
ncbi:Hpt domain-containing protein [Methylobacterium oryzae]|uniref:Hpt domain-containing protein n=1 Tax=Methylobacterium oryzae TaxID=334852 RepID=UPI003AF52CB2